MNDTPPPSEPSRVPLHRAAALLISALAIANAGAVVSRLPPRADWAELGPGSGSLLVLMPAMAALTGVAAAALSILIAAKARPTPGALTLAHFLALLGLAWSSLFATLSRPRETTMYVAIVGLWLALGVWLRFTALFPRPITAADLALGRAEDDGDRRALRALTLSPAVVWVAAVLGALMLTILRATASRWTPSLAGPLALTLLLFVFVIGTGAGVSNLRIGYAHAGDDDRRRMLWILQGATLASTLLVLFVLASLALPDGAIGAAVQNLMLALAPLALVFSLAVAVLYHGALDPGLVLRATTLYGATAIVLMMAFEAVQVLVTRGLTERMGWADASATWIAGGMMAIALRPVHRGVEKRTRRLLDDLMPASVLTRSPTGYAAVLFSDMVGYTALSEADRDRALTALTLFHRAAQRSANRARGRRVKTMGDAVLLEFPSCADALRAAVELERALDSACTALDIPDVRIRTGINAGTVVRAADGDLFGDVVNVAARVQGIAAPGEVVVTEAVARAAPDARLEPLGPQTLKNVGEPVVCYRLAPTAARALPPAA